MLKTKKTNKTRVGANASVCPSTKACPKKIGNRLNQPNAITLVALVITIIILIILAGVSLNLALGENGIFVKSKEAVNKYKDSAQREQNEMDNLYNTLKSVGKKGDDDVTPGDDPTAGGTLQPGSTSTKTEKDNYKDTNNDTATIPAGFKVSDKLGESTVDTGLVVIDVSYNEWVWIPVSAEQLKGMYTESETDINLYSQTDVKTKKYSKLYTFNSSR